MPNEIKTIKLSKCEVDIAVNLTWGQSEKIQSVMMSGAKIKSTGENPDIDFNPSVLLEAKYTALELLVKEIREGEQKVKFTREWMDNLSMDDGNILKRSINN